MSTSVVYPVGIAPALGHLHASRNEIEIFVEDTSAKNVWRELLIKFLPEGVRFNDPIQLGGRAKVLQECMQDQAEDGRKKLYIIDADLDLLSGRLKPNLKHLYRLRSYCVENYLLSQSALIDVATILDPNVSRADAFAMMNFGGWLESNRKELFGLFQCYAITKDIADHLETVGYHSSRLVKEHPENDTFCPVKTARRIFGLYRNVCAECDIHEIRMKKALFAANASRLGALRFASGKDYLFPLVKARLRRLFGTQMSDASMKVLLARSTQQNVDPYLTRRFRSICSN